MSEEQNRFEHAVREFDAANARDPNRVVVDGIEHPGELLYARRMTAWLDQIAPHAPEPLRLAARAQHLCRWMRPRQEYPMTRAGYHRWRTDLQKFHAEQAGAIMAEAGYGPEMIARVGSLLRKENLKTDPDAQTLEDVICLVFLENYFAEFAAGHPREKVIGIVQKTWKKMSDRGRSEAMKLPLSPTAAELVAAALTGS